MSSRFTVQPGNFAGKNHNQSYVPPKGLKQGHNEPRHQEYHPPAKKDPTLVEGKQPPQGGKWSRINSEVEQRFIIPTSHCRAKLRTTDAPATAESTPMDM